MNIDLVVPYDDTIWNVLQAVEQIHCGCSELRRTFDMAIGSPPRCSYSGVHVKQHPIRCFANRRIRHVDARARVQLRRIIRFSG